MEVPITVSASGGTLRSLPRKLDSLLSEPQTRAEYELQQAEKDEIGHLKRDLEELISKYLIEPSEVEAPALTAERWVKEARELSYDVDDFVDELIYDGANARISFARKTSRFKIARLRKKLNPRGWITAEISGFRTRVKEMIQRHGSYHLDKCTMRKKWGDPDEGQLLLLHGVEAAHELVDIDGSMKKLESMLLTDDGDGDQHKLKVVSITGFGGVGKTTLAKQLYCHLRGRFECRAFVRSSRKPDMRRLLTNMLSQLRRHQPVDAWEVPDLINNIKTHLQDKKYFIIIDDLWTLSAWDIVSDALTGSNRCSRVLITTEVDILAQACCGHNSGNIVTMKPLGDIGSTELFLSRVFGHEHEHEHECSEQLNEVSCEIIRKCGGFPLAIIAAASLLANQPVIIDKWNCVQNSFSSNLRTNPTPEGMKQVLNLSYNNLPQRLKACMLYLSIYQEDYIIWKDDLVKQWNAEGFISEVEGKDIEEVAGSYFNELINKGMIQPADINYNGEVLSCTVHYMVLNIIRYKSIEENFITAIDHSQTAIRLADKVRRLSLHFGNEEDATPPANMRLSQVRSLAFSGLFKCMPSINEFKLLRVLIFKLWVDSDDTSYNLKEISKLFRLRYLYIDACHLSLELPAEMQQLKDLVTLEIDAKVSEVPSDIVHLHGLSHLRLPGETNLPDRIGHMTSLRTLGYYNLSSNSKDNVLNLGKLTNLWDLRLTCSVVLPDNLESNMQHLGSILGKLRNLKSLTLNTLDDAGATSMSISCDVLSSMSVPPALLERLEFSRRICTFSSLPRWTGKLNKLCILKIAVRELLWNDIDILKALPALTALSLYVRIVPSRSILFDGAGFQLLKYFKFVCTAPCLTFVKGAMPNVRRLKLGFNAKWMEQYNPEHAGFEHLTVLKEISVKIGGAGADAESVLMTAVSKHASNPRINVQLVDWNFYGDEHRSMSTREQEHRNPEEKDEILAYEYFGTQDEESGEVEKKQADSRISTLSESSSRLPVGVGRKPAGMVESDPFSRSSVVASSKKDGSDDSSTTARDLRFELLEKITGGFSKEHEIGSGGYGKVYKGVLNGKEIAVKKLHDHLALDDVQFKNELENLMRVRHQNIVELVGYCQEMRHRCVEHNGRIVFAEMVDRALCFEYLQNGSLDKHLYEEHRGLDWCTRYKIIKGICEGLNYLHGLEKSILHLDLKPANILLDENMVPKIADFGLSRLFGGTHTHITKNLVGTGMYMPPEYVTEGIITKKYDVFSLGVIIIQIMTGREGCSKCWEMSPQQFIELVHQNWKVRIETEATSMHTSAGEDCKQVKRCVEIALNCVKPERQERPTIGDIIHKLRETETMTHEVPMPFYQKSGSASSSHFKTEMVQNWSQEKQRGDQVKDSSNQQREVLQKQSGMQQKDSSNEQPGSLEKEYQEDTKKRAASEIYEVSMQLSQELESVSRQFERVVAHDEKEVRSELEEMKEERRGGGGKQEAAFSKIGPWGVSAGRAHSIKVAPHRLESVTIWSADIVDAFAFSYSDHNGNKHTIGPLGGPGGKVYRIKFAPSEFLLEVSGTTGPYEWAEADVVQTLTLVTNTGSYGPFGQAGGGTPFHTSIQSNDRIVGFFGSGGMFVHAIGVYVRHFEREMVQGGKEVIFGLETMQEEHETVQESYEQESRISDKESDEEHATLQKQHEIMELDVDSNTNKQADSRVSMLLSESSSHQVNPEMATGASRGKSKQSKPSLLSTLPKELQSLFLSEITDGFSNERKLGSGAFGVVYKGILQDGQEIAVKKLGENSPVTPDKQFQNEVGNLMAIQHENIVKLIGFCYETQKKVVEHNGRYILAATIEGLLCYEYVQKGSLEKYLFDKSHRIDWDTRFKIIKGICRGLHFLHKELDSPIVHMDLKPDNILLDDNMEPKIADFGLSRLFGQEQTRMNTQNVVGAYRYMAPEYLFRGEISTQSDIYSLGVLIIEITTREKNCSNNQDNFGKNFIENVRQNWTDEHIASKCSSLDADCLQQVKTCIETGLKCVEIDRKKRPSIVEIVNKLNGRREG